MYIRTTQGLARGPLEYGLGAWAASTLPAGANGKLYQFNSRNGGATTAVYVPNAALATNPVSLLVWIHGDAPACGDEGNNAVTYVKSTQFPMARQLADSQLPYVLVAPTMNWNWGNNKQSHTLGSPRKMNAFLEEVRTGLTAAGWSSAPSFGRLILAGHSRAHVVLNALAASVKDQEWKQGALATLTDACLLDTTYSRARIKDTICNNWLAWARAMSGARLRVFYIKDSGTAAVAECIRDRARAAGLSNILIQGFTSHCSLPQDQMPQLLTASGQAPPKTSSPSRVVADEPSRINILRRWPMHAR
jgi:hypothetical protein